jgi:hypothetical protein
MDITSFPPEIQNKIFYFLSHPHAEAFKNDKGRINDDVFIVQTKTTCTVFSLKGFRWCNPQIYEDHVQATIFSFKHNKIIDDYYENLIKECGDDSLPFARICRIAWKRRIAPFAFEMMQEDGRYKDLQPSDDESEESECSDGASDVSDECRLPEIRQETQTRA